MHNRSTMDVIAVQKPPAASATNLMMAKSSADNGSSDTYIASESSSNRMTIPDQIGIPNNNSSSLALAAAAAAAADASAMPPPPAVRGAVRTTASAASSSATKNTNGSALAKSAVTSSDVRAPSTANEVIPAEVLSSSNTAKIGAGSPSPHARAPTTSAPGSTATKTSTVSRLTEQTALTGSNAPLAKKTQNIVPTPVFSSTVKTAPPRQAVPQPVLSSSVSTTAKAPTTHPSTVGGQPKVVPKYHAKVTFPSGVVNGRLVPTPATASSTYYGKQQPSVSSIPTPSPSAALHRPTPVTSGIARVSHHYPGVSTPMTHDSLSTSAGGPNGSSSKKKSSHPLRRGKWTSEEEAYAGRLINEFKAGLLPLTDGTTLRNFLSKLLNCDPMRISKKFVGNNCIGKQVFRRRVADINRLTPDQIQQVRSDLSELERRFFDRVAQTNRVKTPVGVSTMATAITGVPPNATISLINIGGGKVRAEFELDRPPTPPWLRPPASYKPKGRFAEKMKAKTVVIPPAATQKTQKVSISSTPPPADFKSDTEKAMAALERSACSLDRLARAASSEDIPRTESALEQLARTASAAKFVEDIVNGDNSLGGDAQVQGKKKLSRSALQGSFQALMSMDIHSVENLVELASSSSALLSELNKSGSFEDMNNNQSSTNLSTRMESFIKSLSNANLLKHGLDSSLAFGSLLNATSSSSLFDEEKIAKRIESSTGFSQLAPGTHDSVGDFLSLVASGDIPQQDPNLLKVPLQKVMQTGGTKKRKLSQQQLVALASRLSGSTGRLTEMKGASSTSKKRRKK